MLSFHCTDCGNTINGDDLETVEQIVNKLTQHVDQCPLATFTFESTTDLARSREAALRAVLDNAKKSEKIILQ